MLEFIAVDDHARTRAEGMRVQAGHDRVGFENRFRHHDGSWVDLLWSARWIEAHDARLGVARNVTSRKHAERRQAATYAISEAVHLASDVAHLCDQIHGILDRLVGAPGMVVVTDATVQEGFKVIYQRDNYLERRLPSRACLARWRAMATEPGAHGGLRVCTDGGRANTWLMAELGGASGPIGALMLRDQDSTGYSPRDRGLLHFVAAQVGLALERRRLHDDLMRSACYDELTGLPNRRLFFERIRSAVARAQRYATRVALLYVDVDDFKLMNDRHGHAAGDAVLRETADRLRECARRSDAVARLGGDEFVVLLEDLQSVDAAEHCVEKIRAALARPLPGAMPALRVDASIGIALYPDHAGQVETLLMHADARMYEQKRSKVSRPGLAASWAVDAPPGFGAAS
jgi:diguanylate cyclase (GGDEF)-like protein